MKKVLFSIAIVLTSLVAQAQAQYHLAFVKPTIQGNTYTVTVKMSAEQEAFGLGSNNLRFNYDASVLASPRIVSSNFGKQPFNESTLQGSSQEKGFVSINTMFQGKKGAKGLRINKKGTELLTLSFDMLQSNADPKLAWRTKEKTLNTAIINTNFEKRMVDALMTVEGAEAIAMQKSQPNQTLSLAPNPTRGISMLNVEMPQSETITLTLIDMTGRTMLQQSNECTKGSNQLTLDLAHLPNGTYYLQVKDTKGVQTQKIVKQ